MDPPLARPLTLEVSVEAVWRPVAQHEANDLTDHSSLVARSPSGGEVLAWIGSLHKLRTAATATGPYREPPAFCRLPY